MAAFRLAVRTWRLVYDEAMRAIIPFIIFCLVIAGCRNNNSERSMNSVEYNEESSDTAKYPIIIHEGKKIVYQFGHLTPDKGLKLYYDTMVYPPDGFHLEDSVRQRLSYR